MRFGCKKRGQTCNETLLLTNDSNALQKNAREGKRRAKLSLGHQIKEKSYFSLIFAYANFMSEKRGEFERGSLRYWGSVCGICKVSTQDKCRIDKIIRTVL